MVKLPKNPFHPGEILLDEFLQPQGLSQAELWPVFWFWLFAPTDSGPDGLLIRHRQHRPRFSVESRFRQTKCYVHCQVAT